MNNKDIIENVVNGCPSAAEMTSAVKEIGNGDMKNGLKTLIEYSAEEGMKKGCIKGTIVGISGTLAMYFCFVGIKKINAWIKNHKAKGEKIIQGFEPDNEPV